MIDTLPPAIHGPYVAAYAEALQPVFFAAAAIAVLAFVFSWFLKELPLRQTVGDQNVDAAFLADLFAAPRNETSLHELANKLSLLARHENRRRRRRFSFREVCHRLKAHARRPIRVTRQS